MNFPLPLDKDCRPVSQTRPLVASRIPVTVHSLVMGMAQDIAVANHRAYADMLGYRHRVLHVAIGSETDRTRLLRKYSAILAVLRNSQDREILVFVEDCVAFAEPLGADRVLRSLDAWMCEDGHHRGRANGGLIILRSGASAIIRIEAILARCQQSSADNWTFSRWNQCELEGEQTIGHHDLVDDLYPNLLFSAFGYAMPAVRAWTVSFNPHVLPHAQDSHSNAAVIEHLTACLADGGRPFVLDDAPSWQKEAELPLEGRLSRVGIVLVVLPGQERLAQIVEQNLRLYAKWHGYALYRFDAVSSPLEGEITTLLQYAAQAPTLHEQLLCLTAEALIHALKVPLPALLGPASVLLARSPWGQGADLGMIALRRDPNGLELLRIACEEGREGLEQRLAVELATDNIRLADLATLAPHTAFRDPASFIVRYHGLPDNVKELMMRKDASLLTTQLDPPPTPPAIRTSMSWLRHERTRTWILSIVAIASLISIVGQWR